MAMWGQHSPFRPFRSYPQIHDALKRKQGRLSDELAWGRCPQSGAKKPDPSGTL